MQQRPAEVGGDAEGVLDRPEKPQGVADGDLRVVLVGVDRDELGGVEDVALRVVHAAHVADGREMDQEEDAERRQGQARHAEVEAGAAFCHGATVSAALLFMAMQNL